MYNICVHLQFTASQDKAQKYLLGAFEKLVGVEFRDQLISKSATILKAMYDLDLIEEEAFLEWGKKVCVVVVMYSTLSHASCFGFKVC